MSYQSLIAIVFTPRGGSPTTLVEADGWLEVLPEFEASQRLRESDGVILAQSFFRPLGGATVSFQLGIETDEVTRLAAQNAFLGVSLSGSGELAFVADAWTATFEHAVLADVTPSLPAGTGAPTLVRKYQVTASGIPVIS